MATDRLETIKDSGELSDRVQGLKNLDPDSANARDAFLLSKLGGGLLRFSEAVFPDSGVDEIYAEHYQREPGGRGAHFDIYGSILNPESPLIGVYNLSGRASIRALKMPQDLADSYFEHYPGADEDAFEARRKFSYLAMDLKSENKKTFRGQLSAGTGMVICQSVEGPHIIHDIVPEDPDAPGEFIKIVRPDKNKSGLEAVANDGMVPIDKLVTSALANRPTEASTGRQVEGSSSTTPEPQRQNGGERHRTGRSSCGPGMLD